MQRRKTGKISIFSSLDVIFDCLTSRVESASSNPARDWYQVESECRYENSAWRSVYWMHTFKIYKFKHKCLVSALSKFTHCNAWDIFLCTSDAASIHHFFMKLDIAALHRLFIMKSTCTFNAHYSQRQFVKWTKF